MIIADSCTIILLGKSTVLEKAIDTFQISVTETVLKEVMRGENKGSTDIIVMNHLLKEEKLNIIKNEQKMTKL